MKKLAVLFLGTVVALTAYLWGTSDAEDAAPTQLTPELIRSVNEAVSSSTVLSDLAGGRPFTIQHTGEWRTVGKLSGAAVSIDFGDVVELDGQWPVMDVLNPVSEAEKARGVPDPKKLDIRYTQRHMSASAREFAILVNLTGEIKNITPAPPRPPTPPPVSSPTPSTPPTPKTFG